MNDTLSELDRATRVQTQIAFMKQLEIKKAAYPAEYAIAFDYVKANLSKNWLDNQVMFDEKFNELTGLAKVAAWALK